MPIGHRAFLVIFVALCVAFVPVVFYAGFYASMEPASALILRILRKRLNRVSWLLGIHVSVYIGFFTGVGTLAYILVRLVPGRAVRLFLLVVILALPFVCSFARVLTYSSIQGSGGTYTFWGAVHRYFEKRP